MIYFTHSLYKMEPYTQIYGAATGPSTYLHRHFWHNYVSFQRSLAMPNTAELLLQTHPPSSHNMPSSISSHLFPSYAPQWAFMDHVHHTKPPLCIAAPFLKSRSAFFFPPCIESLWCVDVSTGLNVVHGSKTTLHVSRVAGPLLFCILCNLACQLRKSICLIHAS